MTDSVLEKATAAIGRPVRFTRPPGQIWMRQEDAETLFGPEVVAQWIRDGKAAVVPAEEE